MSSMMAPPRSAPRIPVLKWLRGWRLRKALRSIDSQFWGLIHDHNWLQYHHCDERLTTRRGRRWR